MIVFDYRLWMLNPFVILLVTALLGLLVGNIKFGKMRIGSSGTLFVGLGVGWLIYRYSLWITAQGPQNPAYKSAQEILEMGVSSLDIFNIFLVILVASIGLQNGESIKHILKHYGVRFMFLGFLITFCGAVFSVLPGFLLGQANLNQGAGIYSGALTSSPGLASAIEKSIEYSQERIARYPQISPEEQQQFLEQNGLTYTPGAPLTQEQQDQIISRAESDVGTGYAISYPIGVIAVILGVNLLPKLFGIDLEAEKRLLDLEIHQAADPMDTPHKFDLTGFFLVCAIGYTVGMINFNLGPVRNLNLGSTGATLLASLYLSHRGKLGPINFRMDPKTLGSFTQVSVVMMLSVVGLRYGYQFVESIANQGIGILLSAAVAAFLAILVGFLVGRYWFKINWVILSGVICGGMTSTPGLGASIDAIGRDEPGMGYGATYPFALIGMIVFTILLFKLPV